MEPPVTNIERRGRKRKRKLEKNAPDVQEPSRQPKKRFIQIGGVALVGRYLLKEFDENGIFLGKVTSYDTGLYRVEYEDGDCEDLDSGEIRQFLIGDEDFDSELISRRKKLDKFLKKRMEKVDLSQRVDASNAKAEVNRVEMLTPNDGTQGDGNGADHDEADSCSNSYECDEECDLQLENQAPIIPPPELPPSSGTIGLPEDCVPYLFSVYGFLRSFSVNLFLCPFTLDDFVGCLNCTVPNTLLDAIHVALLRKVRQRLGVMSSDGSELAAECLRCVDWTLLDLLTWPVYIIHYVKIMKYSKGPEWKGFYSDAIAKEYCTLAVERKLKVLQILCDDVLETAELRAEIDIREESEGGLASDIDLDYPPENGPTRVLQRNHRYPILSSSKDRESSNARDTNTADDDKNSDECRLCGMDGILLCCDGCPSAYHSRCIGVSKVFIPEGSWFCPECIVSKIGPPVALGTSVKGAEVFGSDPYGQVFMGTCNHLVVLKVSEDMAPIVRYYNHTDIPTVLWALNSCTDLEVLYSGICQSIINYWKIPPGVLPPHKVQASIEPGPQKEEATVPSTLQTDCAIVSSNYDAVREVCSDDATDRISGKVIGGSSLVSASIRQNDVLPSLTHQNGAGGLGLNEYNKNSPALSNSSNGGNKNGISLRIKLPCKKEGSIFKPHAYINHYVHGEFAASAAVYLASLSSEENRAQTLAIDNPKKALSANISLQTKAFSSAADRFFWPSTEKKLFEVPRERCGWCLSCQGAITSKKACLLNAAALNATRVATKVISGLRLSKNVESCLYSIAMYTLYLEESLHGLLVGPFQSPIHRLKWRKQVEMSSSCSEIKASLLELEGSLRTITLSGDWTKLVDDWIVEPLFIQTTAAGSMQKRTPGRPPTTQTIVIGSTQKRGRGRPPKKHIYTVEVVPDDSVENSNDYIWWRGRNQSKLVFQRGILPHAMLKKAARLGGKRKIVGLHYADNFDIPKRSTQLVWRAAVERSKTASHLALQVRYLDHHIRWSDLVRPEQTPQDLKGIETESSAFRNAFICDKRVAENKVMFGVVFGNQKHLPSRLMKSIIEKEETPDGKEKYWFLETRIPLYLIKEYEQQQLLQTEKAVLPCDNKPICALSSLQKKQLKDTREKIFLYLVRKRDNMGACCFCASCQQDVLLKNTVKCTTCEGYCHKECTMSSTVQANENIEYIITCKSCVHAKHIALNKKVESPTSPLTLQGQEYQNGLSAAKSAKQKPSGKHLPSAGGSASNASGLSSVKGKKKHNGINKLSIGSPDSAAGANVSSVSKKQKKSKKIHENSSGKRQPSSGSNLKSNDKKKLCSLGLIWKKYKKNEPEDSGVEFRSKNILMKGNPDNIDVSQVDCRSCQKKYDPSFTYIHCEYCKSWYHALTVELDESKLEELIGFKCCKCRRIKQPTCPLTKKPLHGVIHGDNDKFTEQGKGSDSFPGYMSEQADSSIPSTPITPIEEEEEEYNNDGDDVYIEVDDTLLSSVKVEDVPEPNPELNMDWNAPSMAGPQKLPVRRQNTNSHEPEPDLPIIDPNDVTGSVGDPLLPPHAAWDFSAFDQANYEAPDYEPQTYFSYTELLASDDAVDPAVAQNGPSNAWDNVNMDDYEIEEVQPGNDQLEPAVSIPCHFCFHTEPAPELFCQNCGIFVHSHCSPWEEVPQDTNSWQCGRCRSWR